MTRFEAIIRPRIEGQLRGFIHEHPGILDCVLWFKPNQDKGEVLINSLSKRIINDLTSEDAVQALKAALLEG